jgi:DNA-binding transcriptional ArsR family regulator
MEWTAENNKETINGLLDDYADLLAVYREFVDQNLDAELPTKLKALQTLKSLATTIDTLLKRWSFAYRGYDGNTHQAREDATRSLAGRQDRLDNESEFSVSDIVNDAELVELKIVLRGLPEMAENGHPIDGKPFTPPAESMPVSPPPVKKTKTEVVAEIFEVLESGEQTTAVIAEAIGRSERSVRRDLTALISDGKVSVVKKGVYRLHRSVKWTEADNEVLINELLGVYTVLIDACKGDVKAIFSAQDLSNTEKLQSVKTFNACVSMLDRLMKRWSLVHLGWSTNPRLAKADAAAKTSDTEKVDLAGAPLEALFKVVTHYHPSMREICFSMPAPLKPPDDEVGVWSYDATTQELFPPADREPISEAEARRRLMNRKSTTPAALILYG